MDTPQVGGTYAVDHSRKGRFNMTIEAIDGEWASGVISSGRAKALMPYNEKETGEEITVRISLATFKLLNVPA